MLNTNVDEKKIVEVVKEYMDAVYCADVDTLKTIFHEEASMNGYLGDTMLIGTPQPFYDDIASKPSMKQDKIDCTYNITSLCVRGKIAAVRMHVYNFYGVCDVIDAFHMLNVDGAWRIVCKTFTTV